VEKLMGLGIGNIVTIDNYSGQYVITGMENHERLGDCSYSREYYVMELNDIENKDYIKENEGIKIECRGTTLPLHEVDNVAPFRITKEIKYKVERMKAKTLTVYE
jgi:hypothetical protein